MLCVRAAASRTFWTAGTSRAIRMAMMAITTNNSISVNPLHLQRLMVRPPTQGTREIAGPMTIRSMTLPFGEDTRQEVRRGRPTAVLCAAPLTHLGTIVSYAAYPVVKVLFKFREK